MQVDLVSAKTEDGLTLHGIYMAPTGPTRTDVGVDAMLMVHGSAGNFYSSASNRRAEMLREMGIAVALFNTRGNNVIAGHAGRSKVGNAFEVLDECRYDIAATVKWLVERGHQRVGIWGASLGAVKVIYAQAHNQDPHVAAVISLSPLRLSHKYFLASELGEDHRRYYEQAKALVDAGRPDEIMHVTFPIDSWFSAAVYLDRHCTERYDLTAAYSDKVRCPLLIIGGTEEDHPRMRDAVRDIYALAKRGNPDAEMVIVEGGDHGLQNKDPELMSAVVGWLQRIGGKVGV